MTVDEILKLHELGYTKEEIAGMDKPEPKPADPEPKPADPEPKPADPGIEQMKILKQMQETNTALLNQLKDLQKENAREARQPEPAKPLTADDIIKDFMRQL